MLARVECTGDNRRIRAVTLPRGPNPATPAEHPLKGAASSRKGDAMTKEWVKLSMMAAGFLLAAASLVEAQSAQHCAPREQVVERLASKYGETRQSMGLGSNNSVVEVFASVASGSWTITVTMANGVTCLVASGQAFEELAEALPPEGDDA